MSKWYYSFTVEKTSNYVISLHQDDDRFKEELSKRQTMDISLTILKKDAKSKEIQIVEKRGVIEGNNARRQVLVEEKGHFMANSGILQSLIEPPT